MTGLAPVALTLRALLLSARERLHLDPLTTLWLALNFAADAAGMPTGYDGHQALSNLGATALFPTREERDLQGTDAVDRIEAALATLPGDTEPAPPPDDPAVLQYALSCLVRARGLTQRALDALHDRPASRSECADVIGALFAIELDLMVAVDGATFGRGAAS